MTNYNEVFDEKQYREVNLRAALKYLDLNVSAAFPLLSTKIFDAYEYLHPILDEATGARSGVDYTDTGKKMNVRHNHEVIELFVTEGLIQIRNQDIWKYGDDLIADKFEAKIEELVKTVDDRAFHGPLSEGDLPIAAGILGQLTPVIDKSSGTDHACATKGEIWRWLKAMIETIPLAMRQQGPDMVLFINEKTIAEASAPDRIYQDKVEWDFIKEQFIDGGTHGRKIGQVIITDKINANLADSYTTGWSTSNGYQSADTLGTDGRMLLFVPDKKWVARIESAGFHKVGEKQDMLSVDQLYGWHGRFKVFDSEAVQYSERLSF